MVGAAIVLSCFAAIWAAVGLTLLGMPHAWIALPIASSGAMVIRAIRSVAVRPPAARVDGRRIGRLVAIWSTVEGVSILIAANVLQAIGRPELMAAATCTIVGLHFVPLARGFPYPAYYSTAGTMTVLGGGGMIVPRWLPPAVVCFGAAVILWLTLLLLLHRRRTDVHEGT